MRPGLAQGCRYRFAMSITADPVPHNDTRDAGRRRRAAASAGALAVAAAVLTCSCSGTREGTVQVGTPRQVSSPSEPMRIGPRAGQWPAEVEARIGQPVMIRLPGTAGTGYMWQLSSPACEFLPLVFSQQLESSTDGRVGGPSEWVFTFAAQGAGTCNLSFQYSRPWERGVAPAETRSVSVKVVAP